MDEIEKELEIQREVEKRLEQKKLDDKLCEMSNLIKEITKVYPEMIVSLGSLREAVESLSEVLEELSEKHDGHFETAGKVEHDVDIIFHKLRDLNTCLAGLESKIVDKNNSGSMLEVLSDLVKTQNEVVADLIKEQNVNMIDLNNPNSIVSELKKDGRRKNLITWGLTTAISIITLLQLIFKIFPSP